MVTTRCDAVYPKCGHVSYVLLECLHGFLYFSSYFKSLCINFPSLVNITAIIALWNLSSPLRKLSCKNCYSASSTESWYKLIRTSRYLPVRDIEGQCGEYNYIYTKQKHPGCKKSARPIRSSIANRHV